MCRLFKGVDVNFCQFLNRSLTDVPSLFLNIFKVPFVIQNEIKEVKNKVVKSQWVRGI